jgi:2-polyprenyl-6-methoxyphenol hydroxylase-like FAD-dependent oxidoreductase
MSAEEQRSLTERVFAQELNGCPLISNASAWHCLPVIRNRNWSVGNVVLIGDALHSTHPTIGSGTRIAMEDAIALADALDEGLQRSPGVPAALMLFRERRESHKQKLIDAADRSSAWYEEFASRLDDLSAVDFVFDFLMRTGRIGWTRLLGEYPLFMERYAHCLRTDLSGATDRGMRAAGRSSS